MPFAQFEAPIRQTALFCGMVWEPPLALYGAEVTSDEEVAAAALAFRQRLSNWSPAAQGVQEIRRPHEFE
jgi:putative NADPH-quinone reductase